MSTLLTAQRDSVLIIEFVMHSQVWDNDGDFMLIEAAYSLPKWLKPEVAANRIWIRGGSLLIIPQPSASDPGLPAFPTVREALLLLNGRRQLPAGDGSTGNGDSVGTGNGTLRSPLAATPSSTKVEAAVMRRIGGLPEAALAEIQRPTAQLPIRYPLTGYNMLIS